MSRSDVRRLARKDLHALRAADWLGSDDDSCGRASGGVSDMSRALLL